MTAPRICWCGAEIAYTPGVGRPPKTCLEHRRNGDRRAAALGADLGATGAELGDLQARDTEARRRSRMAARINAGLTTDHAIEDLALRLAITPDEDLAMRLCAIPDELRATACDLARLRYPDLCSLDPHGLRKRNLYLLARTMVLTDRRLMEVSPGQLAGVIKACDAAAELLSRDDSTPHERFVLELIDPAGRAESLQ